MGTPTLSLAIIVVVVMISCGFSAAAEVSFDEAAKLIAADGDVRDYFGHSVAVSDDTALVGALGDEDNGTDSGSAYVFRRDAEDPETWRQVAKLTASDGSPGDYFGVSVAIDGDTAVIGASNGDGLVVGSGAAYVFQRDVRDPRRWSEVIKLSPADGNSRDSFGGSVAIRGDTVVVAAQFDNDRGADSGSAYVFERDAGGADEWGQVAKLIASDGIDGDRFGKSVAISGGTVVVGAFGTDRYPNGDNYGSAYVFDRTAGGPRRWGQVAELTASDGEKGDSFGVSVAISGDTILVGAYFDDAPDSFSGSAYVFEQGAGGADEWREVAKLTAADLAEKQYFGHSVAISGDSAVIGAYGDDGSGTLSGKSHVFVRDAGGQGMWGQVAQLAAADGMAGDLFGWEVSLSGETAIVGAYRDDDLGVDSGSAYVFSLSGCALTIAVEPVTLRAGEQLRVAVDLAHRRPITVTVPFLFWVEDAGGRVIVEHASSPVTMKPGDRLRPRLAVRLPPGTPPGTYQVLVGVRRMQQGIAWASRQFEIVE